MSSRWPPCVFHETWSRVTPCGRCARWCNGARADGRRAAQGKILRTAAELAAATGQLGSVEGLGRDGGRPLRADGRRRARGVQPRAPGVSSSRRRAHLLQRHVHQYRSTSRRCSRWAGTRSTASCAAPSPAPTAPSGATGSRPGSTRPRGAPELGAARRRRGRVVARGPGGPGAGARATPPATSASGSPHRLPDHHPHRPRRHRLRPRPTGTRAPCPNPAPTPPR